MVQMASQGIQRQNYKEDTAGSRRVIKPCPFCKGEIEIREGDNSWEGFTAIICRKQGSPFCISKWLEMTKKAVEAAWIKHRAS